MYRALLNIAALNWLVATLHDAAAFGCKFIIGSPD
jgi:hypothetical protein